MYTIMPTVTTMSHKNWPGDLYWQVKTNILLAKTSFTVY